MEEKEKFGEQPNDVATSATNVGIDNVSQDSQGSPLGKFKDVESLLKAYNNLQSEFTKKCQTLNELLKEQQKEDNVTNAPQYVDDSWQKNVDEFFKIHPAAKIHTKAIADVLASDKVIANSNNSLGLAYSTVLENENKKLNSLLNDKERIFNQITPEIKEKIISEYLKGINKNSPFLLTSSGGNNIVSTYKKPINIIEAGEMAKKIFK